MKKKQKIILWIIGVVVISLSALIPTRKTTPKWYQENILRPGATKSIIKTLNTTVDQYKADVGEYPRSTYGLESLCKKFDIEKWNGPYIEKIIVPKDHWGSSFHYEVINDVPLIISPGTDRKLGTWDDIETSKRYKLSEPVAPLYGEHARF